MPDGTIRADAPKIEYAVLVFCDAGDPIEDVDFSHVTADVAGAMPGESASEQGLDRACGGFRTGCESRGVTGSQLDAGSAREIGAKKTSRVCCDTFS